jgi:hypothetical protein
MHLVLVESIVQIFQLDHYHHSRFKESIMFSAVAPVSGETSV